MDGASFGTELGYPSHFLLHVFIKLTAFEGVARIKGSASVQPLLPTDPSRKQDQLFDPGLQIFTNGNRSSFPLLGQARFPFSQSSRASASPLTATFEFPVGSGHSYFLASASANSSCHMNTPYAPNVIDYRGFEVPDANRDEILKETPSEAYVVMAPLVNMLSHMEKFATLLDRHIQWHRAMGFTRHILYMRATDILVFAEINAVKHWIRKRQLLLVLWEILPTPNHDTPYFDQRLVYNHAMLAFSNAPSPVWLANINLDEYVMSSRKDLFTFQDMAAKCSSDANPVSLQVPSYSATRSTRKELITDIGWWVENALEDKHPITSYSIVSSEPEDVGEAIYRPDFAHTIHSHVASIYAEYSHTIVDSDGSGCMYLLHLKQLYKMEELPDEYKPQDSLRNNLRLRADKMPRIKRTSTWLFNSATNTSDPWASRRNRKVSLLQKFMAF